MDLPEQTTLLQRVASYWPAGLFLLYAIPVVGHLLPAYESHLSEIYQPLRALKFFATSGQDFHKYGPMPNFLLAVPFGLTLLYWYVTGAFSTPSDDFPYGFEDPLSQLTTLIVEGRVVFALLAVVAMIVLLRRMRRARISLFASSLALAVVLATNYMAIVFLPSARPDSAMLSFAAMALGVYLTIVDEGLTMRRGILCGVLVACAASSKEIAATMFILPGVGIAVVELARANQSGTEHTNTVGRRTGGGTARVWRMLLVSVLAVVVTYGMLSIVYAPTTWFERMRFWVFGYGTDAAIWGGQSRRGMIDYLLRTGATWLNLLGPGGMMIAILAFGALLVQTLARVSGRFGARGVTTIAMLVLPVVSVVAMGLLPLGYVHDRFYLPAALAIVPLLGFGLDCLTGEGGADADSHAAALWARGRFWVWRGVVVVLLLPNVLFATFAWHKINTLPEVLIERFAQERIDRSESLAIFSLYPSVPGKHRLSWKGYDIDWRPIQTLQNTPSTRPEWILAHVGDLGFVADAKDLPARARMLREETGFDVATWRGVEALGYEHVATVEPTVPRWFPFAWMPAVREHLSLSGVAAFRRVDN